MSHEGLPAAPFAAIGIFLGAVMPLMLISEIFIDGNWTFDYNTLSDLGASDNELVACMFNGACMFGGLLISVFGIGKYLIRTDQLDKACGAAMVLAGIFLFLVGIFTKDNLAFHIPVSFMYFILMMAAMFISMFADFRRDRKLTAAFTSILIVITFASIPGFYFAGFEVIMVGCSYVWMIFQSLSLAFGKD